MKPSQILVKFLQLHPNHVDDEDLVSWCPFEKNSILLKFDDGTQKVFTYNDENNWFLKPARRNKESGWFKKLFK